MFSLELLTNNFKQQLKIALTFEKQKLLNEPLLTDTYSVKDKSLDFQTKNMYRDNIEDMEDFVPLKDKDEEFQISLSAIKKEAANIKAAQYYYFA